MTNVIEKLNFRFYLIYIILNLNSHMWPGITIVYSTEVKHVLHRSKFYWTGLLWPDPAVFPLAYWISALPADLLLLTHIKLLLPSGLLHRLFSLSRLCCWLIFKRQPCLSFNVTSSERPFLSTQMKVSLLCYLQSISG